MSILNTSTNKVHVGIFLDFETGDLTPQEGACTQISLQAVRLDNWQLIGSYNSYIKPYYKKEFGSKKRKVLRNKRELELDLDMNPYKELVRYAEKALTYSGITMEQLEREGKEIEVVAQESISFIKSMTITNSRDAKPILIAHNAPFDIGFFQHLMFYGGQEKEFEKVLAGSKDFHGNFQPTYICTIQLAKLAFANDPAVNSFKLEILAELLGVEIVDAHDADADTIATYEVSMHLSNRMRNNNGSSEGMPVINKPKTREHFKI